MLDGLWYLYSPDGKYLGRFETRFIDVLMLNSYTMGVIKEGDIVHMKEVYSMKWFEAEIGENFRGREDEFCFKRLADLPVSEIPEPPVFKYPGYFKRMMLWVGL